MRASAGPYTICSRWNGFDLQAKVLTEFADAARKGGGKAEALTPRTIGEDSPFDRSFGYYAHGVGPETAILPEGWPDRLVLVSGENTRFVRGWCLEVHDLAVGKYVAGRPKDLAFTEALIRHGMLDRHTLDSRLAATRVAPAIRELTERRIARQFEIG